MRVEGVEVQLDDVDGLHGALAALEKEQVGVPELQDVAADQVVQESLVDYFLQAGLLNGLAH